MQEQRAARSAKRSRSSRPAASSRRTRRCPPASTCSRRTRWSATSRAFRETLGLTREEFLDLGRVHPGRRDEPFNMAVLAIRTAGFVNGVSRLHGQRLARRCGGTSGPACPPTRSRSRTSPTASIPQSWISDEMRTLYDRYLGPGWAEQPGDTRVWGRAEQIPGEELWRTHERRRERLVAFARRRLAAQLQRARRRARRGRGGRARCSIPRRSPSASPAASPPTSAATLLLRDPERLERILNAPEPAGADPLRRQGPSRGRARARS